MKYAITNPVNIVQEHVRELNCQYRATDDQQKKEVLEKRLRNLQNVLRFLAGRRNCADLLGIPHDATCHQKEKGA